MQIKTTMRCRYTPATKAKIKNLTIPSAGEDVEQLELTRTLLVGMQKCTYSASGKSLAVSCKVKCTFIYDPAIPF